MTLTSQANPRYLRAATKNAGGKYGFSNEGFRGMGIRAGEAYDFSVWARPASAQGLTLKIEVQTPAGEVIGQAEVVVKNKDWQKQQVRLTASATEPKAQLYIWLEGQGAVDLDMISLFPQKPGRAVPGACGPIWCNCWPICTPVFCVFPAAVSSKAANWPPVISGKKPSVIPKTAS